MVASRARAVDQTDMRSPQMSALEENWETRRPFL
jgi:hypothetical protein